MPVASMMISQMGGGGQSQGVPNMASGLVSGIAGYLQRRKAKKLLKGLHQPQYTMPNEVLKNQKMAELAANEGMPSQQYNNAMKNFQRNQAGVLAGSMDRRSALMALPQIQRQTNDAMGNLDAQDATMRQQNQRTLYGINSEVGKYRDKEFDINRMQPYQRDYSYAMGLLGAGNQNLIGGIDKLLSGGGQLWAGGGGGGGTKRKAAAGSANSPTYYNGYDENSSYGNFETGY